MINASKTLLMLHAQNITNYMLGLKGPIDITIRNEKTYDYALIQTRKELYAS